MLKALKGLDLPVRPRIIESENISIAYLDKNSYVHSITKLMDQADKNISITMFGISESGKNEKEEMKSIIQPMISAAIRGLNCKIIVPNKSKFMKRGLFNSYAALSLDEAGWSVLWSDDRELLHQKQIIIDREITIIGSHNISRASATTNRDVSVIIQSKEFADIALKEFKHVLSRAKKMRIK